MEALDSNIATRAAARLDSFISAPATSLRRRRINHLAYWLVYPLTVLECGLMACLALLHHAFWRVVYALRPGHMPRQRPTRMVKQTIDTDNALGVMQTLEDIGRASGARLFWLSGTLLGLERQGRPLAHDTDMDAGVCVDDPHYPDLIRALAASAHVAEIAPQFISLKARIQNPDLHVVPGGVIRFKSFVRNAAAPHLPPVKTDIFLHFDYCGGQMHGSRNSLWWNSPFEVVHRTYAGREFAVPRDAHLHLTENYGDYRSEVRDFENSIDCPNAMNVYSWASLAYLLMRQFVMLRLGRADRAALVNRRIRATLLKGIYPLCLRRGPPGIAATGYRGS